MTFLCSQLPRYGIGYLINLRVLCSDLEELGLFGLFIDKEEAEKEEFEWFVDIYDLTLLPKQSCVTRSCKLQRFLTLAVLKIIP